MVMFPWEKLLTHHRNPPDMPIFRNEKVQKEYDEFKKFIVENNIDINEYIYKKFLGELKMNFIENTFPYDVEDNCKHFVIWFDTKYYANLKLKEDEEIIIDKIVRNKFKDNQYVYFENVSNNKSVPDIKHFHVFIKN